MWGDPHISPTNRKTNPGQQGNLNPAAAERQDEGSTDPAQVRHHSPVGAEGGPVAEEPAPVVGRAPFRGGEVLNSQDPALFHQGGGEVGLGFTLGVRLQPKS